VRLILNVIRCLQQRQTVKTFTFQFNIYAVLLNFLFIKESCNVSWFPQKMFLKLMSIHVSWAANHNIRFLKDQVTLKTGVMMLN